MISKISKNRKNHEAAAKELEVAEAYFKRQKLDIAIKEATQAKILDPKLPNVDNFITAYKIHKAVSCKQNWYVVLGISECTHFLNISKRYKQLALMVHPDKNVSAAADGAFKHVKDALDYLSDPVRKKEYDTALEKKTKVYPVIERHRSSCKEAEANEAEMRTSFSDTWEAAMAAAEKKAAEAAALRKATEAAAAAEKAAKAAVAAAKTAAEVAAAMKAAEANAARTAAEAAALRKAAEANAAARKIAFADAWKAAMAAAGKKAAKAAATRTAEANAAAWIAAEANVLARTAAEANATARIGAAPAAAKKVALGKAASARETKAAARREAATAAAASGEAAGVWDFTSWKAPVEAVGRRNAAAVVNGPARKVAASAARREIIARKRRPMSELEHDIDLLIKHSS